ncbi:MAG: hypothetical protein E7647_04890 [Ruminococcaceae bacterium]|nr:hypothetical protein [Oscillospiraceae bacterium]
MKLGNLDKKTVTMIASVAGAFVLIFVVITVVLLLTLQNGEEPFEEPAENKPLIGEMNGVWIASISNIDFPSRPDLTKSELKAELDSIVENTAAAGLDTIFFQVRPSSDALYKSEIFPVSKYLSSEGKLTLDCLEYIIKAAKKEGISVHAWINPLRVAVGGTTDDLPKDHPAKANPSWCQKYADGKIYYDCGIPKVRELVADGIREIVENYDVAGVVFDDYFYPYPYYETDEEGNKTVAAFADGDTFSNYGTEYDDIGDWRRNNVNCLVELSYKTVKKEDKDCLFGVSPFGIWKNGYGDESGSATRGSQSYFDIYCDSLAWAEGGYVDYIAPQLYWTADTPAASYTALTEWWAMSLEGTGTAFVVSHAAYRYDEWESPSGIMTSQVENAKGYDVYRGSIFYGYDEIVRNKEGITDELKKLYIKE